MTCVHVFTDRHYQIFTWKGASTLLLLVGLSGFPFSKINGRPEWDINQNVKEALLAGNWSEVADSLDDVNSTTPSPVKRLIKGHACLALNRNNESLCLFLSILTEDPLERKKNLRDWEIWTHRFLTESPTSVISHYLHGDALARLERWDEALEAFDNALALGENHPLVLNAQGVVYAARGNFSAAGVTFRKASKVNSQLAAVMTSRGTYVLQKKTDPEIALEYFTQALQIAPDDVLALNGAGSADLLLREWDDSASEFKKARGYSVNCLSEISAVINMNYSVLAANRNEAISDMLAQVGSIEPGMSLNEKLQIMDTWTPEQQQLGFDLLNNAHNFNNRIQGDLLSPTYTNLGINAGVSGTLVGPTAYFEATANNQWDWSQKSAFNTGQQSELMNTMSSRYGINQANPINDFTAFTLQHAPGMQYGDITRPGGISSKEIEGTIEGPEWDVFSLYGLLYSMGS